MEKELENSEKKKRRKQPKPAHSAQPGRAPACPRRLSAAILPRARPPPSLAAQWGQPVGASFLPCVLPLSLSVSRAQIASHRDVAPRTPFLLSLRRGPALSVPPPPRSPWTDECALAHVAGFLSHDARPHAQLPS
jgi:hypothetical protein